MKHGEKGLTAFSTGDEKQSSVVSCEPSTSACGSEGGMIALFFPALKRRAICGCASGAGTYAASQPNYTTQVRSGLSEPSAGATSDIGCYIQ